MAIVTVIGRSAADIGIVVNVLGMGGAVRREDTPLIQQFARCRMAVFTGCQTISHPGTIVGIVASVDAAAVGIGEGAHIIQGTGQIGAAEVDGAVMVGHTTNAGKFVTSRTARRHRRSGMISVDGRTFIRICVGHAITDMTGITVGLRTRLKRPAPTIEPTIGTITVVGVLEGVLTVTKAERGGVATGTMNGCAVIRKGHIGIELNTTVAMVGSKVVEGRVASLVGMADIAVINAIVTAVQLGIVAVALTNACDPGEVKITVAVAALRPVTIPGRSAPAPLPGAFIVMTVDQSTVRTTGRYRAGDVAYGRGSRHLRNHQSAGFVSGRRCRSMTSHTGAGRTDFPLGHLEGIIMGISRNRQGSGMKTGSRQCSAGALARIMTLDTIQSIRIRPGTGRIDEMAGIDTGRRGKGGNANAGVTTPVEVSRCCNHG